MTSSCVHSRKPWLRCDQGALVVLLLLVSSILFGAPAPAGAGDVLAVPLRWCVMDGSPALTNPMGAPAGLDGNPEPDTDNVLWRRHERASDNIWIPGAEITFRSGITFAIRENATFPVIPDPCPPTTTNVCQGGSTAGRSCTPDGMGGSADCDMGVSCTTQACPMACTSGCLGNLGDVFDPGTQCRSGMNIGDDCTPDMMNQDAASCGAGVMCTSDVSEYNLAVAACTAAWDALTGAMSTNLLGQVAVNMGVWRDLANRRTGLKGRAQWSTFNGDTCAIPPTGVTMATGGAVLVLDNQNFVSGDLPFETTNERMVAHELGHTLQLGHGDGVDNNMMNGYDQLCDTAENTCATPRTFMSSTGCGGLTTAMTTNQRNTSRALASVYSGVTVDPPGVLDPGPTSGDQRSDTPRDVTDTAVDIVWLAMQQSDTVQRTAFFHALFGTIPFEALQRQYLVFADLDGNPATGGEPSTLGFPTSFTGAELVTKVLVHLQGPPEFVEQVATPMVWRFMGGSFVQCTPASDPLCMQISAEIIDILGGDDSSQSSGDPPRVVSHVIRIEMPNAIVGAVSDQARMQAVAQQILTAGELDRLPDGAPDGARLFMTEKPVFPACLVTPNPVQPGSNAMVEATLLVESQMAKVFLGDAMVAGGQTDAMGSATIPFHVPIDTKPGLRLVTVGTVGSALTADCFVEVLEPPLIILTPDISLNAVGESHTVTAKLRDDNGNPVAGAAVAFSVSSGPNAGTTFTCNPAACTSNAAGMVSFTYLGDGGIGADQMAATFTNPSGPVQSNTALKFWDQDLDDNDIPDTCDVDCNGFGGLCQQVVGCGGSGGRQAGDPCSMPRQCAPGLFCADGVCCDSPCDGFGQICNQPSARGMCVLASPAPTVSPAGLITAIIMLAAIGGLALGRRRTD